MKWTDALSVLSKIAPSLASAAGGPLAGSAVTALEGVFGLHPEGDLSKRQDAVTTALAGATPETLLAVRKADQDYQSRMAELGFADAEALSKLTNEDRDSARKRELAVRDWTPRMLACSVTIGFFGILGYMSVRSVPTGSKDMLNIMLGSLGAAWIAIVSYYFGSSSESSRKTDLLATGSK
jgi:hypothetical protein